MIFGREFDPHRGTLQNWPPILATFIFIILKSLAINEILLNNKLSFGNDISRSGNNFVKIHTRGLVT
jgi:hypothetical protein